MEQQEHTTVRVSLAVLDDTVQLWRLLVALAEQDVPRSQCGLWSRPDVMDGLAIPLEIDATARAMLAPYLELPAQMFSIWDNYSLSARSGSSLERELVGPSGEITDWMQPELRGKLVRQAMNGGVIVVVSSRTANQHAMAARLLLVHGSHDLHTHEFSRRTLSSHRIETRSKQ